MVPLMGVVLYTNALHARSFALIRIWGFLLLFNRLTGVFGVVLLNETFKYSVVICRSDLTVSFHDIGFRFSFDMLSLIRHLK